MPQQLLLPFDALIELRDGAPGLRDMYERHYAARHYRDGRRTTRIVGPGEYLILTTPCRRFLIAFRRSKELIAGHTGVYLTCCRNEGAPGKTSDLIRLAVDRAWERWPGEPIFTFINPTKINSPVPGYCFRRAAFRRVGTTRGGLLIFRRTQRGRSTH